jgi:hypothetical protein
VATLGFVGLPAEVPVITEVLVSAITEELMEGEDAWVDRAYRLKPWVAWLAMSTQLTQEVDAAAGMSNRGALGAQRRERVLAPRWPPLDVTREGREQQRPRRRAARSAPDGAPTNFSRRCDSPIPMVPIPVPSFPKSHVRVRDASLY